MPGTLGRFGSFGGKVKLLGLGSGFLAMNATLAARNVDLCLLPSFHAKSESMRPFSAISRVCVASEIRGLLPEMEIDLEKVRSAAPSSTSVQEGHGGVLAQARFRIF